MAMPFPHHCVGRCFVLMPTLHLEVTVVSSATSRSAEPQVACRDVA